jgi:ubiquinone/menaquinone biosynthesis C-methylase UbiE
MLEPQPRCYRLEYAPQSVPVDAPTDAAVAAAHLQLTGLRAGMDALDVGCGNGAVTCVMSTIVGPSRVTGVESRPARLAAARTLATERGIEIEFLEGDATQLPLPAASYDYTWSRFLFAALPQPARALAELVRVTRPGGSVVAGDLDGAFAPFHLLAPALQEEGREALRLLAAQGWDPWVGRKLYGWFVQAGLDNITMQVLPYQVVTGGVPAGAMAHWRAQLELGTQCLVAHTGEQARWERFRDALLEEIQRPDLFTYSTLILVRGTVPESRGAELRSTA